MLDLWGVVHDGVTLYPGAAERLAALHSAEGTERLTRVGHEARASVRDDGPGLSPDEAARARELLALVGIGVEPSGNLGSAGTSSP